MSYYDLGVLFGDEDDKFLDEHVWWWEQVLEYEEGLDKSEVELPEVVDAYYANLINRAHFEFDSKNKGFLEEDFRRFPEWRFDS